MANADEYEAAIAAAKTNPGGLTSKQQELLATLQNEHSDRGTRAREALNGTSGTSWGALG